MAASRFHQLTSLPLVAALASAMLLAGCGEHHVAPAQEASVSAPRGDTLAGAPADVAQPPPETASEPPPPPARAGDADVVYDLGPVVRGHDTMVPIPNPPEARAPASAEGRRHRHHRSEVGEVTAERRPVLHHRHAHARRVITQAAAPAVQAHPHATTRPAKPAPASKAPATAAAKPIAKAAVAPREAKAIAAKPSKHAVHATPPAAPKASDATGDRGAKLSGLQAALKGTVGRAAVLSVPDLKADQPADVTLTLPADFASTVRDEAGKQGLQNAAASVNVTALLAGDGYAVAPDAVQSMPLTIGQPTEFHWTVTAQPGARGALHADVGADLLGGGDEALQLGSVSPAGAGGLHVSPRAWGAGLLVLLAVIVFAWLGRGRGTATRRRARPTRAYEGPPLDMRPAPPPAAGVDREG